MAHAAGHVILTAVAWAEPATEITACIGGFIAERHATQMGTNADHHNPLLMPRFNAVGIGSRITQF